MGHPDVAQHDAQRDGGSGPTARAGVLDGRLLDVPAAGDAQEDRRRSPVEAGGDAEGREEGFGPGAGAISGEGEREDVAPARALGPAAAAVDPVEAHERLLRRGRAGEQQEHRRCDGGPDRAPSRIETHEVEVPTSDDGGGQNSPFFSVSHPVVTLAPESA